MSKLKYSLSTKLSITTGIVAALIATAIAMYALLLKRNEVLFGARRDIDLSRANTALNINQAMSQVVSSMNSNAWLIRKCLNTAHTDSVAEVVTQIMELNPEVTSCGVIFGVDTVMSASRPHMISMSRDDATIAKRPLPALAHDPRNLSYQWLREPLTTGRGNWSGPHADLLNGNEQVCTYLLPIGSGHTLFFVDIPVDYITHIVDKADPRFLKESFLLGDGGRCISYVSSNADTHSNRSSPSIDEITDAIIALGDSVYEGKGGALALRIDGMQFPSYYTVINPQGWALYYVVDTAERDSSVSRSTRKLILIFVFSLICMYFLLSYIIKRMTRPLRQFSDSAIEISKGNFRTVLPKVDTNDEMAQLHASFETMQKSIIAYMREGEESARRQAFIMGELLIARRIQDDLLPKVFPPFPERDDINVHATLIPAKQIGGDLYNYFIRDERLFFIIGDVSGKSVPAAMVMAIACTVFKAVSALSTDPAQIMHELNMTTCANNEHSAFFITALVGILNLNTGALHLCNAGHDPSIVIKTDGSVEVLKLTPNLPVGIKADCRYSYETLQLEAGDRLVLYTDGITEAEDAEVTFYGRQRLIDSIKADPTLPLPMLIDNAVGCVQQFIGNVELTDDLTIMAIEYTPSDVAMPGMLNIISDKPELERVKGFTHSIITCLNLDKATAYKVELVIEEAVSNIINYASTNTARKNISIYAALHGNTLRLIIGDDGRKFDPTLVPDADTTALLDNRPVGGLGITIMRSMTTSMKYHRIKDRNYLTLELDLTSEGEES